MRLQPVWVELGPIRQIQSIERKPLCKTLSSVIFLELDTGFVGESRFRKCHIEDSKNLMPKAAFVDVDILPENRQANDFHRNSELFAELADDCFLCGLTELDRTAERANILHTSSVIQNFCGKKVASTPMEAEGFEADSGCRTPSSHHWELQSSITGRNGPLLASFMFASTWSV